ncbi:hypothetical protein [Staphylococcus ureilyticus]|uniref:hypothetical protein n=1 Tax=Staphylococcus ureilyticus TaxID=94138 RepID=UPI0021CF3367|nr:hypothetical protein [Staphylococcus ureilyticus]UXS60523.1 hypothetical protein MUA21_02725 [Staphylococcus ureilyticus]
MRKVPFILGASVLSGALLFGNGVADASTDEETLKDDAVNIVSEKFGYEEGGLHHTGKVNEKGNYYEIAAYQDTGVGGLKIIKINKETGAVQYGDNDLKDFESAGFLNLSDYEDN